MRIYFIHDNIFFKEKAMTENLFKKLTDYSESGIYPFCMPGHKRNFAPEDITSPYKIDITEVEDFDDLHKCEGILGDIQNDLADIYGCGSVFMSVNGSSACNLAAIISLPEGGRILAASNCHRSVFNALKINHRTGLFIEPARMPDGLCGGISPDEAESFFNKYNDIRALVVTSPTYEGFTSDIASLADTAHRHGALLIADEAHGAHLPFCSGGYFPKSALYLGADIIIESLHKTLPSLNQTSLVFVPHDRDLAAKVKESLNMVMTTSPSYILMASVQEAVFWSAAHPGKFAEYEKNLKELRAKLSSLEKIRTVDKSVVGNYNISGLDPGKLTFAVRPEETGLTGVMLADILLKKYSLQLEKSEKGFAVAMTSVMDTKEGFDRLEKALSETDRAL